MDAIPHGTSETRDGGLHLLRYELHLPHPVVRIWAAVATPEGLPTWLAAADVLEPRVGGAVALRWLNTNVEGQHTITQGTVTAWDPERVAEYTVAVLGRIRFHLEPSGEDATTVRFTHEFRGTDELRLDCLAGWHQHFELLADALDGRPVTDWSTWTADRWRELRDEYVSRP
ncbi:SRPBCC domain-containing protein [Streptomyces sp. NBC_01142]|uniref:SRPBCC domain-containing protein n=1 Tax=Streptomyces sp. NBC_01142 TaxID=2975865 RepID=UPI00224F686D|nr:SRPBCC domain-containing protein [Streptomyces sp. NBC_01142]MCX4818581.1 SRPBCC domain-containing protein [Streptomyces sp. NBC_01142]